MALNNHITTNFPELRFSIFPLEEVNRDNFVYGYLENEYPLSISNTAISLLASDLDDILSRGMRPFDLFDSLIPLDVMSQLQEEIVEFSNESTPIDIDMESLYREEFNTSFLDKLEILNEVQFKADTALHSDFDNVSCLSFREGTSLPKREDLQFLTNHFNIVDPGNDQSFLVTFSDGTNERIYEVTNGILKKTTRVGLFTIRRKMKYAYVSGTLSETKRMKSFMKSINSILTKTDFRSGSGVQGEIKKGIQTQKSTFSFRSKIGDMSSVNSVRRSFGNNLYGVLIYANGDTPTQTVPKDNSTTKVADFTNCASWGYVYIKDFDPNSKTLLWQGVRSNLPVKNNSMFLRKFDIVLTNSEFESNITGWANNSGTAVAAYSSGKLKCTMGFDTNGVIRGTGDTGSFNQLNQGNRLFLDFQVDSSSSETSALDIIVRDTSGGVTVLLTSDPFAGPGRYTYYSEPLASDVNISDLAVDIGVPSSVTNFDTYFDFIRLGECVETDL